MSEISNAAVISSTSSPSPPADTCYQPVLTVKSFFASFGICVGAYLLTYGILWLIAKIMERRNRKPARTPEREYFHKFAGAVISMKRTIVLGENVPGLKFDWLYRAEGDTRHIGPKDHLAYFLHHIDAVSLKGDMDAIQNGEIGRYLPELMDVIVGMEVPGDGEVESDAPNPAPNNYFPTAVPIK